MTLRIGSKEARALFDADVNLTDWQNCLSLYTSAVAAVAAGKSKSDLIDWDNFLWNSLSTSAHSREPAHIVLSELADVMKWKLARGKARPLQKLVESNSEASVKSASTTALGLLSKGDWEGAINSITALKAVGVATGTAILSPFSPQLVPFMADEVMEAVSCKRDYTLKVYKEMREALVMKAEQLSSASAETPLKKWTAEEVGKALWVRAMMAVYPALASASSLASSDVEQIESGRGSSDSEVKRSASAVQAPPAQQQQSGSSESASKKARR